VVQAFYLDCEDDVDVLGAVEAGPHLTWFPCFLSTEHIIRIFEGWRSSVA
jgi:hypothetical protein